MLRARSRTVGANTVYEQYVIMQPEAVVTSRVWASSLRIPNRASASQPLFTVWNGGTTNLVSVRRLSIEIDPVLAVASGASPVIRMYRMSTQAATPGGTVITPVRQYTTDAAFNSAISVRADHQADTVSATTALAAGTLDTNVMWTQTVPRASTLAGFFVPTEFNMLPNDGTLLSQDPLVIRPSEGFCLRLEAGAALTASTWTFAVKTVLGEFTYP